MRRITIAVGLLVSLFVSVGASAQTISPLFQEFSKGKASGEFTVSNAGLKPIAVTIEPMGFNFTGDKMTLMDLNDNDVKFKLSEMSLTLGPHESHKIYFDVRCRAVPCHLAFFARFTPSEKVHVKDASGQLRAVNVALHLPTSVYICSKAKDCRKDTREKEFAQSN